VCISQTIPSFRYFCNGLGLHFGGTGVVDTPCSLSRSGGCTLKILGVSTSASPPRQHFGLPPTSECTLSPTQTSPAGPDPALRYSSGPASYPESSRSAPTHVMAAGAKAETSETTSKRARYARQRSQFNRPESSEYCRIRETRTIVMRFFVDVASRPRS